MLARDLQYDDLNRDELAVELPVLALVEHEYEPAANDSAYSQACKLALAPAPTKQATTLILYEEYHPYGTTAYRAVDAGVEVSAKRYRYSGLRFPLDTRR